MKRFFLISLSVFMLLTTMPRETMACASEGLTHNYYMFSMYPQASYDERTKQRIYDFWKAYTNQEYYYWFNANEAMETAEKKNDREMVKYLELLSQYLSICDQLQETWSYPTKEQLAERQTVLKNMNKEALTYSGSRLKGQYMLLAMRANMLLKDHEANKSFWETQGKNLPASLYRDMMENIYAGALLHLGQKREAWEIFASQGDFTSIKWSVRKFRNVAGIQSLYAEDPNSNTLVYLVQDFVNNAQETIDSNGDDEMVGYVDRVPQHEGEVRQFLAFADQVVKEKKSESPCMWLSAKGMLQYLLGDGEAVKTLDKAMKAKGTERMKDNARLIRLLASTRNATPDKKYSRYLTEEFQWIDSKAISSDDPYYNNAADRIIHKGLIPMYEKNGRKDMAMALFGYYHNKWMKTIAPELKSQTFTPIGYSYEYFYHLDHLNADQIAEYYSYIKSQPKDEFEQYILKNVNTSDDYWNDLIGTKYIAEGRFTKALPHLKKVSNSFLSSQSIAYYMKHRDFNTEGWFQKQRNDEDDIWEEMQNTKLTSNKKVQFCEEMLQMQSQYAVASGAFKEETAYKLATSYYQASFVGDCWFLTHYGKSVMDTVRVGELDYRMAAKRYLNVSKLSSNQELKMKSLYALAFIPVEPWEQYSWELGHYVADRGSAQYQALNELNGYVAEHKNGLPEFITKCDVLIQFRKTLH